MMQKFFRPALVVALLVIMLLVPMYVPAGFVVYLRLALILFILVESMRLFKIHFIDHKKSDLLTNIGTSGISILVIVLILESIFMFVPRSHGSGYALSGRLWFKKYWTDINSLGHRDTEPAIGKDVVLFSGDSFTAGQGLNQTSDRFSDLTRTKLKADGTSYEVNNLGRNGADTREEFKLLKEYLEATGNTPKTIVLQYFGNDIEKVAVQNGMDMQIKPAYFDVPAFLKPMVKGSYLANNVYWMYPRQTHSSYVDFLTESYNNEAIFTQHTQDLDLFVNFAQENSVKLVVVLMPFLFDTEMSKKIYTQKIADYFNYRQIPVIDVGSLVEDLPVEERVINANDAHGSVEVNKRIAEALYTYLN